MVVGVRGVPLDNSCNDERTGEVTTFGGVWLTYK